MRVLVTGGRKYSNKELIEITLDEYHERHKITCLIQGGATGADWHAAMWAAKNYIEEKEYKAEWENLQATPCVIKYHKSPKRAYNALAGYNRNSKMLREGKPDVVIAFPGGDGTANMISLAKAAGVPVIEIKDRVV